MYLHVEAVAEYFLRGLNASKWSMSVHLFSIINWGYGTAMSFINLMRAQLARKRWAESRVRPIVAAAATRVIKSAGLRGTVAYAVSLLPLELHTYQLCSALRHFPSPPLLDHPLVLLMFALFLLPAFRACRCWWPIGFWRALMSLLLLVTEVGDARWFLKAEALNEVTFRRICDVAVEMRLSGMMLSHNVSWNWCIEFSKFKSD